MDVTMFEAIPHLNAEVAFGDVAYAEILTHHLRTVRAKITVDGSRHFRRPSGLGDMPHDGALIFAFEKRLGAAGTALMADLAKIALKVEQIDGVEVVEFRDQLESDVWASFIAMPRADLLVVASDRGYLEALLRRRSARTGARAFPSELPEWRLVDVMAPYWALRHYRIGDVSDDPTSPFAKTRDGKVFDVDAVGVTAHAGADGRTIVAHYLSRSANAEPIARRMWHKPGDGIAPLFRRAGKDAIEARFTAKDEEDLSMFFFYSLASLGHAVYL